MIIVRRWNGVIKAPKLVKTVHFADDIVTMMILMKPASCERHSIALDVTHSYSRYYFL